MISHAVLQLVSVADPEDRWTPGAPLRGRRAACACFCAATHLVARGQVGRWGCSDRGHPRMARDVIAVVRHHPSRRTNPAGSDVAVWSPRTRDQIVALGNVVDARARRPGCTVIQRGLDRYTLPDMGPVAVAAPVPIARASTMLDRRGRWCRALGMSLARPRTPAAPRGAPAVWCVVRLRSHQCGGARHRHQKTP